MKLHESYELAKKWKRLTGASLRVFVEIMPDGDVIPDTVALEKWLLPQDDESIEERLREEYGENAVNIIEHLFS